jgi:hypothetical protein
MSSELIYSVEFALQVLERHSTTIDSNPVDKINVSFDLKIEKLPTKETVEKRVDI